MEGPKTVVIVVNIIGLNLLIEVISKADKNDSPFFNLKLNDVINTRASFTKTPINATTPKPDKTLIGIPCNK